MNMHITTKLARMASRLKRLSEKHSELEERIAKVLRRPSPDEVALRRLKREKQRVWREIQCYDGVVRSLSRRLPVDGLTG